MNQEQTSIYVDKFYEMDPEWEDLLPDGTHLRDGMIVLLEDSMLRADNTRVDNRWELPRLRKNNRWCVVSHFKVTPRYERSDDYGRVLGESSPLVSFVATYPDGVKTKRQYDASYAWLVKSESVPSDVGEASA